MTYILMAFGSKKTTASHQKCPPELMGQEEVERGNHYKKEGEVEGIKEHSLN